MKRKGSLFTSFAKGMSLLLGDAKSFIFACLILIIWGLVGYFYHYNDRWLLLIDTFATLVTFMMVFLIQNTQNRNIIALQLKLDEIIRAMEGAHNELLKIENATDEELHEFLRRYEELSSNIKKQAKGDNTGTPEI